MEHKTMAVDGRGAIKAHLESVARLLDSDREILETGLGQTTHHLPGEEILPRDALLDSPRFVTSGWVGRTETLWDGRRQIIDLYIPGDLFGYCSRPSAHAQASYVALGAASTVAAGPLIARTMGEPLRYPGLTMAWRAIEEEIEQRLINQIVRNSCMLAHERIAHLINELRERHRRARLEDAGSFAMPLTQEMLGSTVGLSAIHVNRILQQLRREHVIRTRPGRIEILDMQRLEMPNGVSQ